MSLSRTIVGVAAVFGTLTLAVPAHAWQTTSDAGTLTITADPGEANRVDVDVAPNGRLEVTDGAGAPRVLGPGCEDPDQEGVASCDRGGITRVVIETGDLDDAATVGEIGVPVEVRLGDGNDNVSTGSGDDRIDAGSGNDTVDSGAGNDVIVGGAGDDTIAAGVGNDEVDAGTGTDTVDGDLGDDTIVGGDGGDQLDGGAGADRIDGGAGDDQVTGGDGDDRITAGEGTDRVTGDEGSDSIDGGAGNDDLDGGGGYDQLAGGDGDDLLQSALGGDLLDGGAGNDRLEGDELPGVLRGGDGNDVLSGVGGADVLDGGAGNDTLDGGLGGDALSGGAGLDTVTYDSSPQGVSATLDGLPNDGMVAEGDDVAGDVETVIGSQGDDRLSAGPLPVTLQGSGGDDVLTGSAGADVLDGGAGNDTLDGGQGADTLAGGEGQDTVTYAARTASLHVVVGGGRRSGQAGENDEVRGDIERVIGGTRADRLSAASGLSVSFYGGAGNDRIDLPRIPAGDEDLGATGSRATCGAGTDTVVARRDEQVAADCEIVRRDGELTALGVQGASSPRLTVDVAKVRIGTDGILRVPVRCSSETNVRCATALTVTRNRERLGKTSGQVGRGRIQTAKVRLRGSQVTTLQRRGGAVRITLRVRDKGGKVSAATGIVAVKKAR
ncbi:calcium-binding protein [Patulibacter sp. SYSU D01012]|uniref:calcium-binding protein n=1 Tax=Patulibacter sp. SYSU D01012 TaxID=2817381 RepID=UPI001B30D477|nr:calcium-binding protein [Patulibacter sp. SYSU D01012]